MKLIKILAAGLALVMLTFGLVACDNGSNTPADSTTVSDNVSIDVGIKVLDESGKAVYEIEKYHYTGKAPNVIVLLEDYLYIEKDATLQYDEYGNLTGIGSAEVGEVTEKDGDTDMVLYTTYWWYRINGKDASKSMEEYIVQNGDAIEVYMAKKSS